MKKFRLEPSNYAFEEVIQQKHKEHETRNTRVSEYLRKYGTGRIDMMPTDRRPEIKDNRTSDEMLTDVDKLTNNLGTEELDVLLEMQNKREDFESAFADIELTNKQKEQYDAAMKILNDKNSSYEEQVNAVAILEELKAAEKVTRAR